MKVNIYTDTEVLPSLNLSLSTLKKNEDFIHNGLSNI